MTATQMLINYLPGEECRVAIVSDGRLEELHSERAGTVSTVGNIYVGKVMNVEPAIQAAFVDFGIGNNGFLHVSDVHPQYFPGEDEETTERIGKKTPRRERPPIQQCLKRGQEVIVQVLKEGINTKGPTLTSYLSIPGRYLVMLPNMDKSGVSKKVEDEEARKEMKAILDQLELPEGFGFIIRTAGVGRNKTELKRDLAYLHRLWTDIEKRQKIGSGPRLLYAESDLLMRALRDIWNSDVGEIIVDNEAAIKRAARFMKIVSPRGTTKLLHYNLGAPMFHAFGLEEQIQQIHSREVPLPSGGYLVIDEAEAMIAIDVNSGKSRESRDSETNAYRTNQEAVDEICRQLKLRDIGGLVLCDLIDMVSRKHRKDIETQFKERLKRDRASTRTLPVSEFGIVEMTRQRMKGSFLSAHFAACPHCSGRGQLRKPDSAASDAMRDLQALLDRPQVAKVEMVVSARMASELLSNRRQAISRMEFHTKKHVDVRVSDSAGIDRVTFYAYDAQGADIELEKLSKAKAPRDLPEWKYAVDPGPEADWSVDTASERAEVPAELVSEPVSDEIDLITDETEGDDKGWVVDRPTLRQSQGQPAEQGEGGGGGRKRRRRRGRGGSGGESGGAPRQQQPQQQRGTPIHDPGAPAPTGGDYGSWDTTPAELRAQRAPAPDSDGAELPAGPDGAPPSEAMGEGGERKRRRRRRRRGRGGNGNGQPLNADGTPIMDGEPGAEAPPSGPRSDSWDVERPAPAPRPAQPQQPRPQQNQQQRPAPLPGPKPQRVIIGYETKQRPKIDEFGRPLLNEAGDVITEEVRVPIFGTPPESPVSAPAPRTAPADVDAGDDDEGDSDDENAGSDEPGVPADGAAAQDQQGQGGGRKRRRRRGGRGRNRGDRADRPEGGEAPGERKPAPQPHSQNRPAPAPKPAPAPAPSGAASAGTPAPTPKPIRTLYGGNRSRLSAAKAASAARQSRE